MSFEYPPIKNTVENSGHHTKKCQSLGKTQRRTSTQRGYEKASIIVLLIQMWLFQDDGWEQREKNWNALNDEIS